MDRTDSTALPAPATTGRWDRARERWVSRYGRTTQQAYRRGGQRWTDWCTAEDIDPWDARRGDVEAFLAQLARDGLAEATVALSYDGVASLYRHLFEDELVDRDPCARVRRPKIHRAGQRRTWLTPLEYAAFLRAAAAMGPDEHAVATIAGMMGLRSAEMCQLDVDSVQTLGGYQVLRFIGKGGSPAAPPMPMPVLRTVLELTRDRHTGPLLRSRASTRLDTQSLVRLVARVGRAADIGHAITPHGLRRTYASAGFFQGVALADMQKGLRHARPETTIGYDMGVASLDRHPSHQIAGFLSGLSA